MAWAESGGFAATHAQGATASQIASDLLRFIDDANWYLARNSFAKQFPAPKGAPA
jgi:hypothetical protein